MIFRPRAQVKAQMAMGSIKKGDLALSVSGTGTTFLQADRD
jgi:hypothetical protein